MLAKRLNPKTKRRECCLVSRDGLRVLQYYGKSRPTPEQIAQTEARIRHYVDKRAST
jgi:hypothetical protein